ncbi:hypothetical protein HYU92_06300 [Candidatus Curtissbacteria bacterium]|nr:hypothetical protein [Candidatus Curtissbacteria bacterium]
MKRKKPGVLKHHRPETAVLSFSEFVSEPPIATTLLVIGLIALVLSILEFSQAVSY